MKRLLDRYIDRKRIITDLIRIFIVFIAGLVWKGYSVEILNFLKEILPDGFYLIISYSVTVPVSFLIILIMLIIFLPKLFDRFIYKVRTIYLPEWIIQTDSSTPQWTNYKEIQLGGDSIKVLKMKLKVRSDFMRFGFKLLDSQSTILSNTGVLSKDNNILIHIGKQIASNDVGFVAFKKGVKDMTDKKITELKDNSILKLKVIVRGNNNLYFYVNRNLIYSTYIETPLRKRLVLLAWGDNQHNYDLIAEDIRIYAD